MSRGIDAAETQPAIRADIATFAWKITGEFDHSADFGDVILSGRRARASAIYRSRARIGLATGIGRVPIVAWEAVGLCGCTGRIDNSSAAVKENRSGSALDRKRVAQRIPRMLQNKPGPTTRIDD